MERQVVLMFWLLSLHDQIWLPGQAPCSRSGATKELDHSFESCISIRVLGL